MTFSPLEKPITRRSAVQSAAATAALLMLGGCGSDSGGGTASGNISALSWVFDPGPTGGGLYDAFSQMKRRFEGDNAGAKVRYENAPFADYNAALTTRIRGRSLEDVVFLLQGSLHSVAWPAVQQQSKSAWGSLGEDLNNWEGAIVEPDNYYGVPLGTSGYVWYYNRSAFDKAGLDFDNPPKTWDELADACEKLKRAGITPLGMAGADGFPTLWSLLAWSNQFMPTVEDQLALRSGDIAVTGREFSVPLDYLSQTYTRGWWADDYVGKTSVDVTADFIRGKIGMVCGIVVGLLDYMTWDRSMANGSYGAMAPPQLPEAAEQTMTVQPAFVVATNKTTKEQETVTKFLETICSKEGQSIILEQSGQLPNRSDVDVPSITRSQGGRRIAELQSELPSVPQMGIKGAPTFTMLPKICTAISKGQQRALLEEAQQLQQST